jgi:hypothetical protein
MFKGMMLKWSLVCDFVSAVDMAVDTDVVRQMGF